MTSTVTIKCPELLEYGKKQDRGEIHLLRLKVIPGGGGYELTWSDEPYKRVKTTQMPLKTQN